MDRDLEEDFRANVTLMEKIKDDYYAQNVYAALCNMRWQPTDVWPVLKDEYWTCSWRCAGGIVADLRAQGEDYMDWYCSGSSGDYDYQLPRGNVPEGVVTPEIKADFASIGWHPSEWPDE